MTQVSSRILLLQTTLIDLVSSKLEKIKNPDEVLQRYREAMIHKMVFFNKPIHGIQNFAASCFFNSILQMVYACPQVNIALVKKLQQLYESRPQVESEEQEEDYTYPYQFLKILLYMFNTFTKTIKLDSKVTATETLRNLLEKCPNIAAAQQQDINEYLYIYFLNVYPYNTFDVATSKTFRVLENETYQQIETSSEINKMLYLNFPENYTIKHYLTLKKMVEFYNEKHQSKPNEKFREYTNYTYWDSFNIIGDNILINLKRYEYDLHTMTKSFISKSVDFPLDFEYQKEVYDLISIIVYIGFQEHGERGHYICVAKHAGLWFLFDDSYVQQLENIEKYINNGYLYLYTKNPNKKTASVILDEPESLRITSASDIDLLRMSFRSNPNVKSSLTDFLVKETWTRQEMSDKRVEKLVRFYSKSESAISNITSQPDDNAFVMELFKTLGIARNVPISIEQLLEKVTAPPLLSSHNLLVTKQIYPSKLSESISDIHIFNEIKALMVL